MTRSGIKSTAPLKFSLDKLSIPRFSFLSRETTLSELQKPFTVDPDCVYRMLERRYVIRRTSLLS